LERESASEGVARHVAPSGLGGATLSRAERELEAEPVEDGDLQRRIGAEVQLSSGEALGRGSCPDARHGERTRGAQGALDARADLRRGVRRLAPAFECELDPARLDELVRGERNGECAAVARYVSEVEIAGDALAGDGVAHLDAHAHV